MLPVIKEAYRKGRLALMLGAGASFGSKTRRGTNVPMAEDLARAICDEMGEAYSGEELPIVYSAAKAQSATHLEQLLRQNFENCTPSAELIALSKYPWTRIYTLNIDDALETALRRHSPQTPQFRGRGDRLVDQDVLFRDLDVITLNGSIRKYSEGLIFSPQEYGEGSASMPPWYQELAQDYFKYTFLFIGTRLNEPLFWHSIQRHKKAFGLNEPPSYVLTPSATTLEIGHLQSLNLTHLPGTLGDMVSWLKQEFPHPPSPLDIAVNRRPELGAMLQGKTSERHQSAFNSLILVTRSSVPKKRSSVDDGKIRAFYKGFKPSWADIADGIPAELTETKNFYSVLSEISDVNKLVALIGPAGSGKTTLLMMGALYLHTSRGTPVYYLREPVDNLQEIISVLEEVNSEHYALFIDRVDMMANDLFAQLDANRMRKGTIVCAERQNIWDSRLQSILGRFCHNPQKLGQIRREDVGPILQRLQAYGPWTRLEAMQPSEREKEIYDKSRRQLLIGLMEATEGEGFEKIIKRDYAAITEHDQRALLVLVGLATVHRADAPISIVGRALHYMGHNASPLEIAGRLSGTILRSYDTMAARHPTYVRHLFEAVIDVKLLQQALIGLLRAFSDYGTPVMKHVDRNEGFIFKSIINHKFVKQLMRRDEAATLAVYSAFERIFHVDGLYWLQYGLALRDYKRHLEALEMFKTARQAFTSPQIEHAYAQQLLIMAAEAGSKAAAQPAIDEAIQTLKALLAGAGKTDAYPLVTMSEGHVSVTRRYEGDNAARELAKTYANGLLKERTRMPHDARLEQAVTKLMKFSATGYWDGDSLWWEDLS